MSRTAVLVGATGLVGGRCLARLLDDPTWSRVRVVTRRPTSGGAREQARAGLAGTTASASRDRTASREAGERLRTTHHSDVRHERLEEVVLDLAPERLAAASDAFVGDDLLCCLGTTIKAAGSQEAFRRVDHALVVEVARLAREGGARRAALVSSVGADASSRSFYLRTKGEAERDVAALGFECLELLRPSFLVGERAEPRRGEGLAIALSSALAGALVGPTRRYRPIEADTVAAAMITALKRGAPGVHRREYAAIVALAAGGG